MTPTGVDGQRPSDIVTASGGQGFRQGSLETDLRTGQRRFFVSVDGGLESGAGIPFGGVCDDSATTGVANVRERESKTSSRRQA